MRTPPPNALYAAHLTRRRTLPSRVRQAAVVAGLAVVVLLLLAARSPARAAVGWQRPLTPLEVTRRFEPPPTPYAAGHRGVDLAGRPGAPVLAAAAGTVSYAAVLAGRGVVVVVHGELRTTYEPVTAAVRRGERVPAGGVLGALDAGHAGCPAAACLHWGLLRGTTYLDPLSMLGPRPVRLLPPAGGAGATTTRLTGADPAAARAGARPRSSGGGPDAATWSLVAVAGAGTLLVAGRRR